MAIILQNFVTNDTVILIILMFSGFVSFIITLCTLLINALMKSTKSFLFYFYLFIISFSVILAIIWLIIIETDSL